MKISELLQRPEGSFSFEIFPPKKQEGLEKIASVVERLCERKPSFVSVTYGAGGGRSVYTADVAKLIQSKGVTALAHQTCVRTPPEQLVPNLRMLRGLGIENILALRGDLPTDGAELPAGHYEHASDFVREIKRFGGFCIGAACYPEKHPECLDRASDIQHLKEKVEAGAEFLSTQMFFDNALFYRFLWKLREAGVNVPVVAGIMPITNAKQVENALKLSGAYMPQRFLAMVDKWSDKPAAMEQAGVAYATDQIVDLLANGINTIHLFTMNKPAVAEAILDNLSELLPKPC